MMAVRRTHIVSLSSTRMFVARAVFLLPLLSLACGALFLEARHAGAGEPPVPHRPFGSHPFVYTAESIRPTIVPASQLDRTTKAFYESWRRRYLVSGCGPGRYYVAVTGEEPDRGLVPITISISEGHGYGMIITALMAGADPNAQTYFDGLYHFFKDHPSKKSPYLMAWNQVQGCRNLVDDDGADSATDGDLDIAFALLLADRQWGSNGPIDYLQEAKHVIAAIRHVELNPVSSVMLLGGFVQPSSPEYYFGARSSDFMPDHFRAFRSAATDGKWAEVIDVGYRVIRTLQRRYSPQAGLVPDFIKNTQTEPEPAPPHYLETRYDGQYSYNACRVPWRLGTDYLISGDPRALEALEVLNAWIRRDTGGDPGLIHDGYDLRGMKLSEGTSLAFVAPLAVAAMVSERHQPWLNALWQQVAKTPLEDGDYFGNTLKMLALLVLSGNWWPPS